MGEYNEKEAQELASRSELQLANKTAIQSLTLICSIISLAYLMEVFKGSRTVLYVVITIVLAMAPVVISWILYSMDHKSKAIRFVVAVGYLIMYAFVLFTAANDLVFTYAIPMMIIIMLYGELRFSTAIGIAIAVCNIVSIIILFVQGAVTKERLVSIEIQGLLTVLIVVYFIWVSVRTAQFEKFRMARLSIEKHKTENLLKDVLDVSERMTESVATISSEMNTLQGSVGDTLNSMNEVSSGANDSADAVQGQLTRTEDIQKYVASVREAADSIREDVANADNEVKKGQESIRRMDELTEDVHSTGVEVQTALSSFQETASKMNSITDLINSVASQTSLLALNASIEAARAGEAGKGFAVVASEISNLAGQTSSATADINSLIEDITSQIDTIVSSIDGLIATGEDERRCAEETTENFNTIADKVVGITQRSREMEAAVEDLSQANVEIVNSIQTISAITEEVNAHANETYASSEANQQIVSNINTLVEELNRDAQELRAHQ
ncbi:MAG: hypothetical protein IJS24_02825 [Eubacterium sp.]|nr:hypothetical protein [Eubacterium sp.]